MSKSSKAISPLIQSILFLIIALAIVGVTFQLGLPYIQKLEDLKAFEQGKELIIEIDGIINKIQLNEISGRELLVNLNKGSLVIDDSNDFVQYEVPAVLGVLEEGFYSEEGNVYLRRLGTARVGFQSNDINIITETAGVTRISPGTYTLQIDYNGSDASGNIKVRFRVKQS